jgi:hypothetical protein
MAEEVIFDDSPMARYLKGNLPDENLIRVIDAIAQSWSKKIRSNMLL